MSLAGWLAGSCIVGSCAAQEADAPKKEAPAASESPPGLPSTEPDVAATPAKVDVEPLAEDADIAGRLERILAATEWFTSPRVEVQEGVVFLKGATQTAAHKEWAGKLAERTQDVVAVVNQITVAERSAWDFSPAAEQLRLMGRNAIQSLPAIVLALVVAGLTWFAVLLAVRLARRVGNRRLRNPLLTEVLSRTVAVPVILLGLYFVLQISGLTRIAATILGGTGIIGLVIGIAFRDIAENFLASILISVQRPFRAGDLVTVADQHGFVQKVTTRGTVVMTLDGNLVQIPNATIYKSIIRNHSANPNARLEFLVGIGYDDSLAVAQETLMEVLNDHPAVLKEPEPLVLVEELGGSGPRLHVFFWINGREHSGLKVRSAIIRQCVAALAEAGVAMPDAREMLFPRGLAIHRDADVARAAVAEASAKKDAARQCAAPTVTEAEGGLRSEKKQLRQQAARSRELEPGSNLLKSST
jgi:small conductance mechanosensitive channel